MFDPVLSDDYRKPVVVSFLLSYEKSVESEAEHFSHLGFSNFHSF